MDDLELPVDEVVLPDWLVLEDQWYATGQKVIWQD